MMTKSKVTGIGHIENQVPLQQLLPVIKHPQAINCFSDNLNK